MKTDTFSTWWPSNTIYIKIITNFIIMRFANNAFICAPNISWAGSSLIKNAVRHLGFCAACFNQLHLTEEFGF